MLEHETDTIIATLSGRTIGERETILLREILAADVPRGIKTYMQAETVRLLEAELFSAPKFARVDRNSPGARRHGRAFIVSMSADYSFPRAEYLSLLENAVHFLENYLCRPQWTIENFVFESGGRMSAQDVVTKLDCTVDYAYFRTLIQKVLQRRGTRDISDDEFRSMLVRIDDQIVKQHNARELALLAKPIFDFLLLRDTPPDISIPLKPILVFFEDKRMNILRDYIESICRIRQRTEITLDELTTLVEDLYLGQAAPGGAEEGAARGEVEPAPVRGRAEPESAAVGVKPGKAFDGAEPESPTGGAVPGTSYSSAEPVSASGGAEPEPSYDGVEPNEAPAGAEPEASYGGAEPNAGHGSAEPNADSGSAGAGAGSGEETPPANYGGTELFAEETPPAEEYRPPIEVPAATEDLGTGEPAHAGEEENGPEEERGPGEERTPGSEDIREQEPAPAANPTTLFDFVTEEPDGMDDSDIQDQLRQQTPAPPPARETQPTREPQAAREPKPSQEPQHERGPLTSREPQPAREPQPPRVPEPGSGTRKPRTPEPYERLFGGSDPREDLTDLREMIQGHTRSKFVKRLFGRDDNVYEDVITSLNNSGTWREAALILNTLYTKNGLDPFDPDVVEFTDVIHRRYLDAEKNGS